MRLYIAEKPSLGRAIAQYLPDAARPFGSPPTHLICGNEVVTWCFGHLLEMAEPEDYDSQYKSWNFASLPIVPETWKRLPRKDAAAQIKAIRALLKDCSEIVHAGDPDREGQLLVDELLEYLGNRKPVLRLWLAALDAVSVRKALADLRDNRDYDCLKASAEARQRGDWLVGMNLTRAYTLAGRQQGYEGVLSIGRVQTPTLALIVRRCIEIEQFQPKDFFQVSARVVMEAGGFNALWQPGENISLDEAGRLLDRTVAERIRVQVEGQKATVTSFEAKEKQQPPPLPYSLSTLQTTANRRYGLSAQAVLDIAQELYEARLTSYPRTDCQHLPESQWADAPRILQGLPGEYAVLIAQANPALRSAAWDDAKITAHHAIIPTGQTPDRLSERQYRVYDLIVRAYLAQFFPPYRYRETHILLDITGEVFQATGHTPLAPGWKIVFGETEAKEQDEKKAEDHAEQALPTLRKGDRGLCEQAEVLARKTTPPAHFTEGTLIAAMTRVHRLVDDPELKKRNFIVEKGKKLLDTPAGRSLILALPEPVKSPGLTGLFEQLLQGIEAGKVEPERFLQKQTEFVRKYVLHARENRLPIDVPNSPVCPRCGEGRLRRIKGKQGWFWGCSRYQIGCRATFPDRAGKPELGAARK